MTVYQKTMREALEEMSQHLNESNLEKMRKAAGGAKQTLKMKDGSIGMDSFSASAIMQIYDKINDKNKKTFENMMNNGKKADIMKLQKFAMSKVNASYEEFEEEVDLDKLPDMSDALRQVRFGKEEDDLDKLPDMTDALRQVRFGEEEVELNEAKYDLYHKDFSSAMQHAYKMAKKIHGITISPDEISDKVATGPRKPSEGKTNKYRLEGDKGGIQIQVYNKGGSKPFELNMYKEEVELDEEWTIVMPPAEGGKTVTGLDSEKVMSFIKSKGGSNRDMQSIKKGKSVTFQGKTGAFYKVIKEGLGVAEAVDPADIDTSATDDDIKSADKNIMMQMRKAVSLRGQYPVEFLDKKKVKIPQKMAQAVIDKYNKQKKPVDKEKFQAKIAKSYKSLMMVVKEQKEESLLDRMNRKILENNNG